MIRLLFCDDVGAQRRGFEKKVAQPLSEQFPLEWETVGSYEGFCQKVASGAQYDIVVTDFNFEKAEGGGPRDGLEILRDAKEAWPGCEVILMTAFLEDIEGKDYRTLFLELQVKPEFVISKVADTDPWQRLCDVLAPHCRIVGQKRELTFYRDRAALVSRDRAAQTSFKELGELARRHTRHEMIGQSFAMQQVFEATDRFAPYEKNVLVLGDTGSGKGMIARAIHRASPRQQKPFNEHNSSTIHENIAEGELFGFAPGSGVSNAPKEGKKGLLLATDGGTLFLDEIGDMPLSIQTKMLKVVDRADGTFYPVGGERAVKVDVRFVLATHRNLEELIAEGCFREDFYYRIKGLTIRVPSLRDRPDDIPLLVADQVNRFCARYERDVERIAPGALAMLMDYAWPGNVRELQDVVDRILMGMPPEAKVISPDHVGGVFEVLEGQPPVETPPPEERRPDLFASIVRGQSPHTLSELKKLHGEPVVREIMKATLRHLARYPSDEQASRWFNGMTANAWRQFAFSHGITLRKLGRSSSEQQDDD